MNLYRIHLMNVNHDVHSPDSIFCAASSYSGKTKGSIAGNDDGLILFVDDCGETVFEIRATAVSYITIRSQGDYEKTGLVNPWEFLSVREKLMECQQ